MPAIAGTPESLETPLAERTPTSNTSVDVVNFSHTRDSWDVNSKKINNSSRESSKPETIRTAGTQGKSTATIRSATSESVATAEEAAIGPLETEESQQSCQSGGLKNVVFKKNKIKNIK